MHLKEDGSKLIVIYIIIPVNRLFRYQTKWPLHYQAAILRNLRKVEWPMYIPWKTKKISKFNWVEREKTQVSLFYI